MDSAVTSSIPAEQDENLKLEPEDSHSDVATTSSPPVPSISEISMFRELLFIVLMSISQLITQASVAQTMNTSNNIAATFGIEGKNGEISWLSASFSLTVGTFILVSGRLGDLFGYKKMYIIGYLWYAVWSLVAGFGAYLDTQVFFSTMRAMQGIGPAIMMPNTQALIGSYYPASMKKNIIMALFGAIAPGGCVVGALFSGMLAELAWWPWSFWMGAMVSAVIAVIAYFVIPHNIGHKSSGSFDYLGAITGVIGLVLINFSFNQGPNVGWDKPYVYVLLIVGFLSIAAFFFIEKRVKDPLVPPVVLQGETGFVLGCIAAGWACFGVWLFYLFRWSLEVDHDTPVTAALKIIPTAPMGYVAAISSAVLLSKFPSSLVMVGAMVAFFVGIILQATRPVGQTFWAQKFVSVLVSPLGMDMSFPAACILLSEAIPKSQQGIAGSLVSTFVNYSISIGLGFAGTVEYYITKDMAPSMDTTVHGFRVAMYMGTGFAGLGIVISAVFFVIQLGAKRRNRKTILASEPKHDLENATPEAGAA